MRLLEGLQPPPDRLGFAFHETAVQPSLPHERFVGAALRDPAFVHHDDLVGVPHGREPVGDHHDGLLRRELLDGSLELLLVFGIDARGRLVEEDHGSVLQEGTGDRDALLLAARDGGAALPEHGFVALRQLLDELVAPRPPSRIDDLLVRGIRLAEADVVLNGVVEEIDVLEHHREALHEGVELPFPYIDAAHRHAARTHIPEAGHEVHERRLARPGRADDRAARARGDRERDVADHGSFGDVLRRGVRKRRMFHVDRGVGGVFDRSLLVHPRRVVHLEHAVDRSVDHRQHERKRARLLDLAVDEEPADEHEQALEKFHLAGKVQPARQGDRDNAEKTEHALLGDGIGSALALEEEVLALGLVNGSLKRRRLRAAEIEGLDNPHALDVLEDTVDEPHLRRKTIGGITPRHGDHPRVHQEHAGDAGEEHEPDAPVYDRKRKRANDSVDHSREDAHDDGGRHRLQIVHDRRAHGSEVAQAVRVEEPHRHVLHSVAD